MPIDPARLGRESRVDACTKPKPRASQGPLAVLTSDNKGKRRTRTTFRAAQRPEGEVQVEGWGGMLGVTGLKGGQCLTFASSAIVTGPQPVYSFLSRCSAEFFLVSVGKRNPHTRPRIPTHHHTNIRVRPAPLRWVN